MAFENGATANEVMLLNAKEFPLSALMSMSPPLIVVLEPTLIEAWSPFTNRKRSDNCVNALMSGLSCRLFARMLMLPPLVLEPEGGLARSWAFAPMVMLCASRVMLPTLPFEVLRVFRMTPGSIVMLSYPVHEKLPFFQYNELFVSLAID